MNASKLKHNPNTTDAFFAQCIVTQDLRSDPALDSIAPPEGTILQLELTQVSSKACYALFSVSTEISAVTISEKHELSACSVLCSGQIRFVLQYGLCGAAFENCLETLVCPRCS